METQRLQNFLERIAALLRSEARLVGSTYGLQPIQLDALRYLSICNRYSDSPLAVTEYLGLTKGTVSQSLKVLESRNLVEKQADKNDRRVVHLSLTHQGRQILTELFPSSLLSTAAAQMSERASTSVVEGLKQLLISMQQANGMRMFGVCKGCSHNRQLSKKSYLCGLTQEPLLAAEVELICREYNENSAE